MEACVIDQPVDFVGINPFVISNYTKSSYNGAALIPHEKITKTLLRPLDDPKVSYLKEKLKLEVQKYPQYLPKDTSQISDITDELVNTIASIEYEKVSVELTPYSTLKFKFILDSDRRLFITKPLDSTELSKEEVVFSIFFNRDLLVSDVKGINELVQGLREYNKRKAFAHKQ